MTKEELIQFLTNDDINELFKKKSFFIVDKNAIKC